MTLDLTDDEAAALTKHLRQAIDYARYPFAPRLDPPKAILAKLEPPAPQLEVRPPLRPGRGRRMAGTAEMLMLSRLATIARATVVALLAAGLGARAAGAEDQIKAGTALRWPFPTGTRGSSAASAAAADGLWS